MLLVLLMVFVWMCYGYGLVYWHVFFGWIWVWVVSYGHGHIYGQRYGHIDGHDLGQACVIMITAITILAYPEDREGQSKLQALC